MKTFILLNAFSNINQGPGPETFGTYTLEIVIMLSVAFLLGYLLRYFLNSNSKSNKGDWKIKLEEAEKEINSLKGKLSGSTNGTVQEAQMNALKLEITAVKKQLEDCEKSKLNIQSFVSSPSETKIKDDLKKIEGIGPKIASLLNDAGIWSFNELASSQPEKIKEILIAAGERYRIHDPSTWPQQASLAAEGKWNELKALQQSLSGGKE